MNTSDTKLDTEDLGDLLPIFLLVNLAENPELTTEQAAAAIVRVIDRHVHADRLP